MKVEVAVLSIPPHIILMVSVDAKHHCIKRTIRLIRVGVPRTATSTFTQLLTELWRNRLTLVLLIRRVVSGSQRVSGGDRDPSRWADDDDAEIHVLGCRLTYQLGTNCDQCLSMVQCCFTSTETVRLIRTESPVNK